MSVEIIHGDCRDVLALMPAESVHALVTDPPYGLSFMGKGWDYDVPDADVWRECMRVLRPGGHLLSFFGTRTYHRGVVPIEDAGFEIRDQIGWLYGQGFPKSSNQDGEWEGWGTALKPAWEPVVVARKPLIGTVPQNLAAYRVGALNIDGCRIGAEKRQYTGGMGRFNKRAQEHGYRPFVGGVPSNSSEVFSAEGRWPANVIHDGSDEVLAAFPDSKGQQGAVRGDEPSAPTDEIYGKFKGRVPAPVRGDTGSAARFFYCAKASRADRNDGLAGFAEKPLLWSAGTQNPGSFQSEGTKKAAQNNHPTVKPTDLMRYLCRLVTPPGGVVLDPFMGSGSTGRGAVLEGFSFIGIEQDESYVAIARARIAAVQPQTEDVFA